MRLAINSRNSKVDNPIVKKIALSLENLQFMMLSFMSDGVMCANMGQIAFHLTKIPKNLFLGELSQ